jgi:hypothetical protein
MKRNIIIALVIIIALLVIFAFRDREPRVKDPGLDDTNLEVSTSTDTIGTTTITSTRVSPSPASLSLKDKSWAVLEQYLKFAKDKNLEGLKTVSYQISAECKNSPKSDACLNKLSTVAFFGQELKKENFKYVWSDSKQIILATDFKFEENEQMISKTRGIIYFVIDKGAIKLLSFNPSKGAVVMKSTASKEELNDRLTRYTEDKDEDGKEDYLEECLSTSQEEGCVKTDTTKRDTNGDGFWDGIEALFYH